MYAHRTLFKCSRRVFKNRVTPAKPIKDDLLPPLSECKIFPLEDTLTDDKTLAQNPLRSVNFYNSKLFNYLKHLFYFYYFFKDLYFFQPLEPINKLGTNNRFV
jgi:hypothetical protein